MGEINDMVQRSLLYGALFWSLHNSAFALQPTCILQAVERKLAGPARNEFLEKCGVEMEQLCEKMAIGRPLGEIAKRLFITNCTTTYVGIKR